MIVLTIIQLPQSYQTEYLASALDHILDKELESHASTSKNVVIKALWRFPRLPLQDSSIHESE